MAQVFSSLLFVPGNRPDRIEKAFGTPADVVCIDLEDAVAPADKASARETVLKILKNADPGRVMVRINGLRTRAGLEDLLALADATVLPERLMVPKFSAPAEAAILREVLGTRCPGTIGIIETVEGLADCTRIAAAPGVEGLMLGIADLSAELGCEIAWEPLLAARSALVTACAAAAIAPVDGPSLVLEPGATLDDETRRSRALGFTAKAAIHPAQLDAIHRDFRPSASQVDDARDALAAFVAGGGQAIRHNGRLLETPIVRQLERIAAFERISHA